VRVAVVGSRSYPDLDEVSAFVDALPESTTLISGGAAGVDTAVEPRARLRGRKGEVIRSNDAFAIAAKRH